METVCVYSGPGSLTRNPEDVKILVCLSHVPPNMERFVNLNYFSIFGGDNCLVFPYDLYDHPSIEHVHIEGNVQLEEEFDMINLKSLTIDSLDNEAYDTIDVGMMFNLEYLCIKNSRIFVKGLVDLRNTLKHLILRNTDMDIVPRSVYRLRRLRTLDLSENLIETVSRKILDLVNLVHFNWSHKTNSHASLKFSVVYDDLPSSFYEMMDEDLSRKSREDLLSEIYDRVEDFHVPLYEDEDEESFSPGEADLETIYDEWLNHDSDFEGFFETTTPVDDGYESGSLDSDEEDIEEGACLEVVPKPLVQIEEDKPEFQIDYISRQDKRVPDWEFLYDSDDEFESGSDEEPSVCSVSEDEDDSIYEGDDEDDSVDDSVYDSDYERDYENEKGF